MPSPAVSSSRSWPPTTNQPRPTSGTTPATTTSTAPIPRRHRGAESVEFSTTACAPSEAATTNVPCRTTTREPSAAWVEVVARSRVMVPTTAAVTAATAATIQQTITGTRVERGISASTASTARTMPSQAGAPRSPTRPVTRSRASTIATGSRPASSSMASPAPCWRAGSHHGRSRTGTAPSAVAGGPQAERSRTAPRTTTAAAAVTTRPSRRAKNHRPGAKADPSASSSAQRQAARQRRSASGSAKPSAAWASHGSRAATTTVPKRPSPHAPLTTGTSA